MSYLYAARYNAAGTIIYDTFDAIADVGIRWALPGGVQRCEVTIRAESRDLAVGRYRYNIGDRIAIMDNLGGRPIHDGYIHEARLNGLMVTYVVGGIWQRHHDRYVTTAPTTTDDSDVYLVSDVLPSVLSGAINTDNVAGTGIPMGDYQLPELVGAYPGKIIEDILAMGDSSGNVIDYWTRPGRMRGARLGQPEAWLQPRQASDDITWQVWRRDISELRLSRDAWDMRNQIDIYHNLSTTLVANANGGATSITVASATGLAEEYEIEIKLDSDRWHKTVIDTISGTTVNLIDKIPGSGTPQATSGNVVRLVSPLVKLTRSDTNAQGTYWRRDYAERRQNFDATQAAGLANAMLEGMAYPTAASSFTISAARIDDGQNGSWPIWRMLHNPGIVRIMDVQPTPGRFLTAQLDRYASFRVIALDYSHSQRAMRVVPDVYTGDQRVDVILQQLGANVGQMVGI